MAHTAVNRRHVDIGLATAALASALMAAAVLNPLAWLELPPGVHGPIALALCIAAAIDLALIRRPVDPTEPSSHSNQALMFVGRYKKTRHAQARRVE